MRLIALSMLAIFILAASALAKTVVLPREPRSMVAGEACVGLSCWPLSFPIKHGQARRATLAPTG
jgi:hypothetical protein